MASTSSTITVLRETLNQLTQDKRVSSDNQLLKSIRRQIDEYEAEQRHVEDDMEKSFSSIFEVLDRHPHPERAAQEYLQRKQIQREESEKQAQQTIQDRLYQYEEKLIILLAQIGHLEVYAKQKDYDKVMRCRQEVDQLVTNWNTEDGPRCKECGEIEKITLNWICYSYRIDRHSFWEKEIEHGGGMGYTPAKYHPCTRGKHPSR
jgi:hypothetical protein